MIACMLRHIVEGGCFFVAIRRHCGARPWQKLFGACLPSRPSSYLGKLMELIGVVLSILVIFKLFSVIKRYFSGASTLKMSAEQVSQIKELIKTKPVFIASKTYCPYCSATKKFIDSVYPDAYVMELDTLDEGSEIQQILTDLTGQRTVPNIFIHGKHIGGNSDLQALGQKKVKELINA